MSDILKISHAHKFYNRGRNNEIHVMNDIDLSLPSCGLVAIFGQSGCGKTTLLNAVGGLDNIQSGSITVFGEDLAGDPDIVRNKYVGYIFQNYNLNVGETVYENVADALRLCGVEDPGEIHRRVMSSLANVGMDKYKDRTPDTLSGGQQQRVAIARAICKGPAIILADEPTGNLDENNTVLVMDILKEISKTRLVLLVTHEANLVDFYCDRVIEIVDGKIVSDRENSGAVGYVQRNKNDIYLGELTKEASSVGGVSFETYTDGAPVADVKIRLISSGGKLYLTCDTPGVRILDESSEVKLREGKFEAAPTEPEGVRNRRRLDMSVLSPVEGKHFGRLFHMGNALTMAWRENYSQRKKKGKRFLRACLVLLAVVLVFMTAVSSVNIKSYLQLHDTTDRQMFFIPVDMDKSYDYSALLRDHVGKDGLDFVTLTSFEPDDEGRRMTFRLGGFMTATLSDLEASGYVVPYSVGKDMKLVCGTNTPAAKTDILITTKLADDLIDSATASYIDEYEDLLGLVSSETFGDDYVRIVGVLDADERYFMMDPLPCAYVTLRSIGLWNVTPASLQTEYTDAIGAGEMVSFDPESASKDTMMLFGKEFRLVHRDERCDSPDQYRTYVKNVYGLALMSEEEYILANTDDSLSKEQLHYAWLFEYMPTYLPEFLGEYMRQAYDLDYDIWATCRTKSVISYLNVASRCGIVEYDEDIYTDWCAWKFHERTGNWPTLDEAIAYADTLAVEGVNYKSEYEAEIARNENRYREESKYRWWHNDRYGYVVSDEAYIALAASVGSTSEPLDQDFFAKYEYGWTGTIAYRSHLMIHAQDPVAAEKYLREVFGDDIQSPDDIFSMRARDYMSAILSSFVSVLVVIGFMCLCVFFIMRSSFMSRVKEVGILRAIGVSKKNLVFRFLVETALLTVLTVGVGYLLTALCVSYLAGAPLLGQIFYFPFWMAVVLAVVLFAVMMLFGVLPALLLLRKTPSEILAKYDI